MILYQKKQNNVLLVTGISEEQILTVPALMPSQRSPRSVCIAFEAYNKTSNYAFNAQGITDIADFLLSQNVANNMFNIDQNSGGYSEFKVCNAFASTPLTDPTNSINNIVDQLTGLFKQTKKSYGVEKTYNYVLMIPDQETNFSCEPNK